MTPSRKPTVYLDTNILSVLFYRGGNIPNLARQLKTQDWWEQERKHFALVTSGRTEDELAHGVYRGQSAALAAARRLTFLHESSAVKQCASVYLENALIPATKFGDAIQLAFAVIHRIDYLLTWNHAHLANMKVQKKLEAINKKRKWRSPWLVSPETIPWLIMGQNIRRTDD